MYLNGSCFQCSELIGKCSKCTTDRKCVKCAPSYVLTTNGEQCGCPQSTILIGGWCCKISQLALAIVLTISSLSGVAITGVKLFKTLATTWEKGDYERQFWSRVVCQICHKPGINAKYIYTSNPPNLSVEIRCPGVNARWYTCNHSVHIECLLAQSSHPRTKEC